MLTAHTSMGNHATGRVAAAHQAGTGVSFAGIGAAHSGHDEIAFGNASGVDEAAPDSSVDTGPKTDKEIIREKGLEFFQTRKKFYTMGTLLLAAGLAVSFVPVVGWIPGAALGLLGLGSLLLGRRNSKKYFKQEEGPAISQENQALNNAIQNLKETHQEQHAEGIAKEKEILSLSPENAGKNQEELDQLAKEAYEARIKNHADAYKSEVLLGREGGPTEGKFEEEDVTASINYAIARAKEEQADGQTTTDAKTAIADESSKSTVAEEINPAAAEEVAQGTQTTGVKGDYSKINLRKLARDIIVGKRRGVFGLSERRAFSKIDPSLDTMMEAERGEFKKINLRKAKNDKGMKIYNKRSHVQRYVLNNLDTEQGYHVALAHQKAGNGKEMLEELLKVIEKLRIEAKSGPMNRGDKKRPSFKK